ncbi:MULTISPECIES: CvpA family protein [Bacteria]|uniref:CvpA family protein n=1 Tax=Bacteria TaxID=2 RepID=UPI00141340D1|nr:MULTISPECIES: CvpA family protein [Bacteria]MCC5621921.1 CvpA family protein [Nostoc sp. CHAB 5715]NBA85153.1 CvpA family protein [Emticicia sp. CRIBPO]
MATIDILLLLPIVFGAFKGYQKGLLIEIIGILAFIIAIVLGFKFLGFGIDVLEKLLGTELTGSLSPYLSFILIFFPTIFLINKMGWMMRKSLKYTLFGTLDGFLGAILGSLMWLFGVSLLLWIISKTGIPLPEKWFTDADFYPFIKDFAPNIISKVSDMIPVGGNLVEQLKEIKNSLEN